MSVAYCMKPMMAIWSLSTGLTVIGSWFCETGYNQMVAVLTTFVCLAKKIGNHF
ncbi:MULTISPECIES: hypothetical protein [Prochlorococcus]|uniref:hypothetical protein n=1 Tax=Prochlorococcus TaxID=1218 RepID=UPI001F11C078|nr:MULTISPECIES: hypothetical protein [Prochlorococcus]